MHYGSGQLIQIRRIAEAHGIPAQFLVQILLQLKAAGLVASTRGAAGGYQLIKDPAEISLGDVIAVMEGATEETLGSTAKQTTTTRVLHQAWQRVASAQRQLLAEITFADLVQQASAEVEPMYYI